MKMICSFAVWIVMGTAIGWGILLAINGTPWLLAASILGFVLAVAKFGCLSSHGVGARASRPPGGPDDRISGSKMDVRRVKEMTGCPDARKHPFYLLDENRWNGYLLLHEHYRRH